MLVLNFAPGETKENEREKEEHTAGMFVVDYAIMSKVAQFDQISRSAEACEHFSELPKEQSLVDLDSAVLAASGERTFRDERSTSISLRGLGLVFLRFLLRFLEALLDRDSLSVLS